MQKMEKGIKNLTRSLGAARDLDVQISVLENQKGLESLLTQHKEKRAELQPDITSTLENVKRVLDDMLYTCLKVVRKDKKGPSAYTQASLHITKCLNEFLAMEDCVYCNDAKKHHEMRIKAKRLRYTMEAFQDIYQLKEEIAVMKKFQDSLGEMHDCDVWMEYTSNGENLNAFLAKMKRRRAQLYHNFKTYYDKKKSEGFFSHLQEKLNH